MMYQPNCLKYLIDLLEVDNYKLKRRVYNVTGMSFYAGEIVAEIKKHIPEFAIICKLDFRQDTADSWPQTVDDSLAREEWGWDPNYDLSAITKDMINTLKNRIK
ncbi:MAG: hypothetical protein ACFFKA_15550 [Candidatus Thorarchaeota archaeon]